MLGLLFASTRLAAQNLNLAFGKVAFATSILDNNQAKYGASFVTDGVHSTRWQSMAADDQLLTVDLGLVQAVDRIRINWEGFYALNFDLQVSSDGVTYTTLKTITNNVPDKRDNLLVNESANLGGRGRFVRVRCLTQNTALGFLGFAINELEVFSFTNTTPNLALNKPVRATDANLSNTGYLYQPSFAVDGNLQTRWSTLKGTDQSFVVDLGQVVPFTTIFLNWESAYGVAFQLQTSTDSTAWTTLATYTNNQAWYNEVGVAASGRYVRMLGQQGGQSGGGFSIYELAVYNAPMPLAVRAGRAPASISLYPNPTASQATLEWNANSSATTSWTLYNSLGQVVYTELLASRTGHNTQALNLRAYAAGIYFLTLEADGQVLGRARVQKVD